LSSRPSIGTTDDLAHPHSAARRTQCDPFRDDNEMQQTPYVMLLGIAPTRVASPLAPFACRHEGALSLPEFRIHNGASGSQCQAEGIA
jgi:hypothetical protein